MASVHNRLVWPKYRMSGRRAGQTRVDESQSHDGSCDSELHRRSTSTTAGSSGQSEWKRPVAGGKQAAVAGGLFRCNLARVEHRVDDCVSTIFYDTEWDRRLLGTARPEYIDTLKHRGRIDGRRVNVMTHVYTLSKDERVGVTYVYSNDQHMRIHEDDFDEF